MRSWRISEDTKARQHVLLCELNGGLTNKAKLTAWERVTAAVNEVGQNDTTVTDKKWLHN